MPYKDYEKHKTAVMARYHERVNGIPNLIRKPKLSLEERETRRKEYFLNYYARPDVKERQHSNELKRKYGITLETKKQMFAEQKGLCGFCGKLLLDSVTKAHVDHNHETGEVRKLLHKQCNSVIGVFENNLELINVLRDYLCPFKVKNKMLGLIPQPEPKL
jgi:hypothetical protein